jgi:hypothetical protein
MADPNIRIKRSSVAGKRPSLSQLKLGELAVNLNDGRLFTRQYNVGIGSTVTLLNVWTENIGGGTYYNEGNVGINTSLPPSPLSIGGVYGLDTTTTLVSSTSPTTIESFSATVYRSSRAQIQITQGTDYQASDVLVIHDGSTANVIEYGSIATNDYLATFSAAISGGNCLLQVNMTSSSSATVKVLSQKITI